MLLRSLLGLIYVCVILAFGVANEESNTDVGISSVEVVSHDFSPEIFEAPVAYFEAGDGNVENVQAIDFDSDETFITNPEEIIVAVETNIEGVEIHTSTSHSMPQEVDDVGRQAPVLVQTLLFENQLAEKEAEFQSLLVLYQQITKVTETNQVELDEARNRLIAYLEADIIRVEAEAKIVESYEGLKSEHGEIIKMNQLMEAEINVLIEKLKATNEMVQNDRRSEEIDRLNLEREELIRVNEILRADIDVLKNQIPDSSAMTIETVVARNQELENELSASRESIKLLSEAAVASSAVKDACPAVSTDASADCTRVTVVEEELSQCQISLNAIDDRSEVCSTNLEISRNIVTIEKLTADNARLELELFKKESSARTESLEKGSKKLLQQLNHLQPSADGTHACGSSQVLDDVVSYLTETSKAFGRASSDAYRTVAEALNLHVAISDESTGTSDADSGAISSPSGLMGMLEVVTAMSAVYCVAGAKFVTNGLQDVSVIATDGIDASVHFYHNTVFPAFHEIVVPHAVGVCSTLTAELSSMYKQAAAVYDANVHPPLADFYESHLASHVNSVSKSAGDFYETYLKEHYDLLVAPVLRTVMDLIRKVEVKRLLVLAGDCVSEAYEAVLVNRRGLIDAIANNKTFRELVGEQTNQTAVFLVNFFTVLLAYYFARLLLRLSRTVTASTSSSPKVTGVKAAEDVIPESTGREIKLDTTNKKTSTPPIKGIKKPYSGLPLAAAPPVTK